MQLAFSEFGFGKIGKVSTLYYLLIDDDYGFQEISLLLR